jgi:hypothetical protein
VAGQSMQVAAAPGGAAEAPHTHWMRTCIEPRGANGPQD